MGGCAAAGGWASICMYAPHDQFPSHPAGLPITNPLPPLAPHPYPQPYPYPHPHTQVLFAHHTAVLDGIARTALAGVRPLRFNPTPACLRCASTQRRLARAALQPNAGLRPLRFNPTPACVRCASTQRRLARAALQPNAGLRPLRFNPTPAGSRCASTQRRLACAALQPNAGLLALRFNPTLPVWTGHVRAD